MNSVAFALAFSEPSYRRGRMDSILCSSEAAGPRFAACEYGVPLQDADAALAALVAWAEDASCPERFLDGPVDIRFGAPDEVWLSQSYQRSTCYIGACVRHAFSYPFSLTSPTLRHVEAVLEPFHAPPHLGKVHGCQARELQRLLPRLEDFNRIRRCLDPDGMFTNRYLARCLP
eukprot:Tamp_05835.p5 GENE.Tamp_05835~~Tamp_05835.p5  ORF type:complete len:174 (-),score=28.38 Tamp_05835:233-754(-)